jgi:hypothetical protein
MKPGMTLWIWFFAVAVTIGCGLYRGWDPLLWIVLGLLMVTGLIRAVVTRWARKFNQMSAEEREKYLARTSPELRRMLEEKLKEKLKDHVG